MRQLPLTRIDLLREYPQDHIRVKMGVHWRVARRSLRDFECRLPLFSQRLEVILPHELCVRVVEIASHRPVVHVSWLEHLGNLIG